MKNSRSVILSKGHCYAELVVSYLLIANSLEAQIEVTEALESELGISPSVIVGKKPLLQGLRSAFPHAKILDRDDFLAPGANLPPMSWKEFEVVSHYWDSQAFQNYRMNLVEQFNRYPALQSLRTLDREVILRKLQVAAVQAISESKPDFVFALDVPHNPHNLAVLHVSETMGLPALLFNALGSVSPGIVPVRGIQDGLDRIDTDLVEDSRMSESQKYLHSVLVEALDAVRNRADTAWRKVERDRLAALAPRRFAWINSKRQLARRAMQWFRHRDEAVLNHLVDSWYTALVVSHNQLSSTFESHGKPFALFMLQFEPEATSVPKGLGDTFQLEAVRRARRLLPAEVPLVVKEHPSQIKSSMTGALGRSSGFYDLVESLPNAHMLSAFSDSEEIVRGASVIFTLTGTIGFEAGLNGKPVIYFGSPWWAGMPGTHHVSEIGVPMNLAKIPGSTPEEAAEFLENLVRLKAIPGSGDQRRLNLWKRRKELPDEFERDFVSSTVSTVRKFLDSLGLDARSRKD